MELGGDNGGMVRAPSAAATARDSLIRQIHAGEVAPGERLDEVQLADTLAVSRNTLRETFRLLANAGYVTHEPHRGVFVRAVTVAEAHNVYQARRFLECGTLRELAVDPTLLAPQALDAARAAVDRAEVAKGASDWALVGDANTEFHEALAGVAGNLVVVRLVRQLMVDMRLLFLSLASPAHVHGSYVTQNRTIVDLVGAGEFARAAVALETYLLASEEQMMAGSFPRG